MSKAIFLDRDGVINEVLTDRVKFVNKPKNLYFLPGVPQAIKKLNEHFPYIFVITNQGGIGLGYMKESQLHKIHDHMIAQLKKKVQRYMMLLTAHINQKQVVSAESRSQSLFKM